MASKSNSTDLLSRGHSLTALETSCKTHADHPASRDNWQELLEYHTICPRTTNCSINIRRSTSIRRWTSQYTVRSTTIFSVPTVLCIYRRSWAVLHIYTASSKTKQKAFGPIEKLQKYTPEKHLETKEPHRTGFGEFAKITPKLGYPFGVPGCPCYITWRFELFTRLEMFTSHLNCTWVSTLLTVYKYMLLSKFR